MWNTNGCLGYFIAPRLLWCLLLLLLLALAFLGWAINKGEEQGDPPSFLQRSMGGIGDAEEGRLIFPLFLFSWGRIPPPRTVFWGTVTPHPRSYAISTSEKEEDDTEMPFCLLLLNEQKKQHYFPRLQLFLFGCTFSCMTVGSCFLSVFERRWDPPLVFSGWWLAQRAIGGSDICP